MLSLFAALSLTLPVTATAKEAPDRWTIESKYPPWAGITATWGNYEGYRACATLRPGNDGDAIRKRLDKYRDRLAARYELRNEAIYEAMLSRYGKEVMDRDFIIVSVCMDTRTKSEAYYRDRYLGELIYWEKKLGIRK